MALELENETVTAREYIQMQMDERDKRYGEMFRAEQRADELIGQRLDQIQRDMTKDLDNVAQRFSDKIADLQRLVWMIAGGAAVLAVIAKFLPFHL